MNPNSITITREELAVRYQELLNENPLLGRIEGSARAIGWTDQEIRTMQLLTACKSNASLMQRMRGFEKAIKP